MRCRALRVWIAVAAAVGGTAAVTVAGSASAGRDAVPEDVILPDLDQVTPAELGVTRRGSRLLLGFSSAVENVGPGPLIVEGRRSKGSKTMVGDQVLRRRGNPMFPRRGVGRLRYTRSPDHEHWHYLRFERYEVRRASKPRTLSRDHKTGFCLGDRYETSRPVNGTPVETNFDQDCGFGRTGLRTVREGISPGWGDQYAPYLEGQSIDITGLRRGTYLLVHRVNVDGRLLETTRANNAASVRFRLGRSKRPGGLPSIRVLRRCSRTATCPASGSPKKARMHRGRRS